MTSLPARSPVRFPTPLLGFLGGLLWALAPVVAESAAELTKRGLEAFEHRADGATGTRARPEPIAEAIAAFTQALELDPTALDARIGLLRALYFQAAYATQDAAERAAIWDRGRLLFEEEIARIDAGLEKPLQELDPKALPELLSRPEAIGRLAFWGAVHWGQWGQAHGKMASVKKGVAKKIRDYAEIAVELAPDYEEAGGLRLLGRLHTVSPRVPLFTLWIDRKIAIDALERAVAAAPENPQNRAFLADALLQHRPRERARALELLESAVASEPRPHQLLEDRAAIEEAREILKRALAG